MGDGTGAHIGDDFHVPVRMRREARLRGDDIVVPHPQIAPVHAGRVVVLRKGEVMTGIEPAMVSTTKLAVWA